ncbi:MAG: hypothetical protein Ct9H300mP28_00960 [Pseudomonadota bacterium]|nr:MAG: hypothetical protein Ct9H300mP28_00960 [Pseudomonadota bacterium]
MYDFSESEVLKQLDKFFEQECVVRLCYPWERLLGVKNFTRVYKPLYKTCLI